MTIDRTTIDYTIDKNIEGTALGTGPVFVYEMWKRYIETNTDDIYVPQRKLFHPRRKQEVSRTQDINHMKELKKNGTYGIHLCSGVWRNNKL